MQKHSPTPRSDSLDRLRIELKQERTAAYGDALALCRQLEKELELYKKHYIEEFYNK